MNQATDEKPIVFYIGSCPDYSHSNGLYTHEGVGENVPLLTQIHLKNNDELFHLFGELGIPFKVKIMVADVEAVDEVFSQRFTNGDQREFLRRCVSSVNATQEYLGSIGLDKFVVSTSFFSEFGFDRFMNYQAEYVELLGDRYLTDSSFQMRITTDIVARSDMYKKMYPDSLIGAKNDKERYAFLVGRDIRTKAQYLTLGRLISLKSNELPAIICHPTKNIGIFNDRNKFLLPEDGVQPQKTLPIFEMSQKVY